MIKEEIGKRIRAIRNSKGYSQEKFAAVCGLDRTYIADVELGKRNISIENLSKIATAFEISLSELFNFTEPIHNTILLSINGERFLLQSKAELTPEIKEDIELSCRMAFDENSDFINALGENKTLDNLYELSVYELAELAKKVFLGTMGIEVVFKAVDLEIAINSN